MLDAMERIRQYVPRRRADLNDDVRNQDAIVHRFMIIGEAASGLSAALRDAHPDVPWRAIIGIGED